jgi:hypothetical protein
MNELIAQIHEASNAGLYYLALLGALVLPDICGALDSEEGNRLRVKQIRYRTARAPSSTIRSRTVMGTPSRRAAAGRFSSRGLISEFIPLLIGFAEVRSGRRPLCASL